MIRENRIVKRRSHVLLLVLTCLLLAGCTEPEIETRYGHLSKVRVTVGQKVSRGDRIGDMGNTGRSTGTHLHYEVRTGGTATNPMTFIKAANNVF